MEADPRENWPTPTTERLLDLALDALLERYPWPWCVECGWGYEIATEDGERVTLLSSAKDARALMDAAARRNAASLEAEAELRDFEAALDAEPLPTEPEARAELQADGIDPDALGQRLRERLEERLNTRAVAEGE